MMIFTFNNQRNLIAMHFALANMFEYVVTEHRKPLRSITYTKHFISDISHKKFFYKDSQSKKYPSFLHFVSRIHLIYIKNVCFYLQKDGSI